MSLSNGLFGDIRFFRYCSTRNSIVVGRLLFGGVRQNDVTLYFLDFSLKI